MNSNTHPYSSKLLSLIKINDPDLNLDELEQALEQMLVITVSIKDFDIERIGFGNYYVDKSKKWNIL